MSDVGRALVILGLVIVVLGVLISVAGKVPWLGRLPGDIYIRRGNSTFYVPLATCLLLSVGLSLLLWLFGRR